MSDIRREHSAAGGAPLRSVHTTTFPQLLAAANCSVMVTTYQAGKLALLRNHGGALNTHFRNFNRPMGLAVRGDRLAIGTHVEIEEFHNVPAVCAKLDAAEQQGAPKHDGCFLPRLRHTTGDVQVHELQWIGDELWFVNTAFSCLATRSDACSFEPQWRPKFITQLVPDDACHLNGLAVRDGRAAYVTALGETAAAGGWRAGKRHGGVLIDVSSREVAVRGLSMPHSPRWHNGQLWLLESGDGSIGCVELSSGRYEPIARLPGFTRGLSFIGRYALVGLSQVRESATFSGIPLVERVRQRSCGVWIMDTDSAATLGFVQFEQAVQEVFAIEVLPGVGFPDVVNDDLELIKSSYVLSEESLSLVPSSLRASR
jgi:uncharacterized protein (TIGR03032 family)